MPNVDEAIRDAAVNNSCEDENNGEQTCKQLVSTTIIITYTLSERHQGEAHNDAHNDNNNWFKPSNHAGHHNDWLKDRGHANLHCTNLQSSRGVRVACSCSSTHRQSSRRRCAKWSKSSGLLVEFASHLELVSNHTSGIHAGQTAGR